MCACACARAFAFARACVCECVFCVKPICVHACELVCVCAHVFVPSVYVISVGAHLCLC